MEKRTQRRDASSVWKPGESGNRGGRPKVTAEVRNRANTARRRLHRASMYCLSLHRRPLQQCHGEHTRRLARPPTAFLLLVCLVRRSGQERLAAPGDPDAASRPRMGVDAIMTMDVATLAEFLRETSTTTTTRRRTPSTTGGTGTRPT